MDIVICNRFFPSFQTQRARVELARVMVSVEERTVVTGGMLKGEKWVPDVDEVGDRKFLELNGSRSKLCAKFFWVPFQCLTPHFDSINCFIEMPSWFISARGWLGRRLGRRVGM